VKNYNDYWSAMRASSRFHPGNRFRYRLIAETLRRCMPMTDAKLNICDLGCGDAELLTFVALLYPKAMLFGIDLSSDQIARNKATFMDISFHCLDAGQYIKDFHENFDIVLSSEVIEHIENDEIYLENLARILKPGGIFCLTTQSGKMYRMDREILMHKRSYNRIDLQNRLIKQNVRIIESRQSGFPILTLQKILVNIFFDNVIRHIFGSSEIVRGGGGHGIIPQ
jgi:2-polyprenyl-3-methyl-5-hydroxy-6-metoxy-1,4-benzoquinol methylase